MQLLAAGDLELTEAMDSPEMFLGKSVSWRHRFGHWYREVTPHSTKSKFTILLLVIPLLKLKKDITDGGYDYSSGGHPKVLTLGESKKLGIKTLCLKNNNLFVGAYFMVSH